MTPERMAKLETRNSPNRHRLARPPSKISRILSQLRRAAMSIMANIAEGFGRFSYRENIQFCRRARGSAFEVHDHLTLALDAGRR